MRPVEKAIWFLESHYEKPITLEEIASVAGVTRFHMSRAFCYVCGMPFSRYLRYRRLTHAAKALAEGKDNILDLALSLGYGSHEAFSRAFKDCFGVTPEAVRRQGHTDNLNLLEARNMSESKAIELDAPQMIDRPAMLLAGISRRYSNGNNSEIPGQWQQFNALEGQIPALPGAAYGVVYNMDDENNFNYLCALEVEDFNSLPEACTPLRLAAQTWAVFSYAGHVSQIQNVCHAAWANWLPSSGREAVDAPFFERYCDAFDPVTGNGGFEVWIPVR